jgi:hypothetical protein
MNRIDHFAAGQKAHRKARRAGSRYNEASRIAWEQASGVLGGTDWEMWVAGWNDVAAPSLSR